MIDNIFYLSSFHLLSFHPDYAQPPYHCKWLLIARRLLKPALEGCLESNLSRQLSTRASAPLSTKPRYLAKGEFEQFYMKQKWLHEKQYIIFFKQYQKRQNVCIGFLAYLGVFLHNSILVLRTFKAIKVNTEHSRLPTGLHRTVHWFIFISDLRFFDQIWSHVSYPHKSTISSIPSDKW